MALTNAKPVTEEEKKVMEQEPPPEGYKGKLPEAPKEEDKKPAEEPKGDKPAEEKPKEEAPKGEKPKEEVKDDNPFFERLEREMTKPEGQEDLKDFSPREKAYFYSMRKDRKKKQEAEAERDAALFRESKLKKQIDEAPKAPDPIEELKKRDPNDTLTVQEALDLANKVKAKPSEEKVEKPGPDPIQRRYLKQCDQEAAAAHPDDYNEVMELVPDIVSKNPSYLGKIAESIKAGENPAETTYTLIKSDPEFAKLFPVAQTRVAARKKADTKEEAPPKKEAPASPDAQRAQEALEKNAQKTKTTGHVPAGDSKAGEEYTAEDIMKMSDREFSRLPKKVRDAYLKKHG